MLSLGPYIIQSPVTHGGQGLLREDWVFHKVAGVESDTLIHLLAFSVL